MSNPFVFPGYGPSSFGFQGGSVYSNAGQMDVRRPGWSWTPSTLAPGPFCAGDSCANVTDTCLTFDGTSISDSICAFPKDVKVAGLSCWESTCYTDGTEVCNEVNGVTIQANNSMGEWCIFDGDFTLFGPACYGDQCFAEELKTLCDGLGGTVWNELYCFLPGYHTIVGPVCWKSACFSGSTIQQCNKMGGSLLVDRWCIIPGCHRSVIGPTCFGDECYSESTTEVCNSLGGIHFAERFCVLDGEWSSVGPTCLGDICAVGETNQGCRDLGAKGNIGGRFCVVEGNRPVAGPNCFNSTCFPDETARFCDANQGVTVAGVWCTLPSNTSQVVGPTIWGSSILNGTRGFCDGLFCAIAATADEPSSCPTSGKPGPGPGKGPGPGSSSMAIQTTFTGWTFALTFVGALSLLRAFHM